MAREVITDEQVEIEIAQLQASPYSSSSYEAAAPTATQTANGITISLSGNKTGAYEVVEDVDLSDIETITATIQALHSGSSAYDKLQKALNTAEALLEKKGIDFDAAEMTVLIEAAVAEFNDAFKKPLLEEASAEAVRDDGSFVI